MTMERKGRVWLRLGERIRQGKEQDKGCKIGDERAGDGKMVARMKLQEVKVVYATPLSAWRSDRAGLRQ